MVCYNFKARFVEPIETGRKAHTIRGGRKRHARPGETMQLQHGSRMRPIRFGLATCRFVAGMFLDFRLGGGFVVRDDHGDLPLELLKLSKDEFARTDGFEDWLDMGSFWLREHKSQTFSGVIIGWHEFRRPT